jgi:hypothetical protein
VFQSTFIGLLVVMVLVVTMFVIIAAPMISDQEADYLICVLLSSDKDKCEDPSADDHTQHPAQPKGTPASPEVTAVTSVDLPGDCDATADFLGRLFPGGHWSGQDFQNLAAGINIPVPPIHADSWIGGTYKVVGCTLVFGLGKNLGPPGEVHTDFDWASIARTIAAAAISYITAAIAFVACVASGTAPICPFIAGYVAGFFWEISLAAMKHGTLNGTDLINAFIAGIAGGALGASSKYLTKLGKKLPEILTKVRDAIEAGFNKMWGWIQDIARAGKDLVVDWITRTVNYFRNHGNPWPRRPAPPALGVPS